MNAEGPTSRHVYDPDVAGMLVTDGTRLASVINEAARHSRVALDLESNGFHRYPERVCLVQLATPGAVYVIDPIAIGEVSPLGRLLADESVEKVFHSADYDLRSLDRDWGFRVGKLFDTSIAAAFCGFTHLGLGTVVNEVLGVVLPKSKRLQRADWSLRPLSAEALGYASEDVRHLLKLRATLGERLQRLGREGWVAEECSRLAQVRHATRDQASAFLAVKGGRGLDGRGLAVLRALHAFREQEALRLDRPPFKVISDATLVDLASAPGAGLSSVKGLGRYSYPPRSTSLSRVLRDGQRGRSVTRPRRSHEGPRLSATARAAASKRLVRLKQWRKEHGQRFELDPALLWPMASMERLSRAPETFSTELKAPEVRQWQRREIGGSLRSLLEAGLPL